MPAVLTGPSLHHGENGDIIVVQQKGEQMYQVNLLKPVNLWQIFDELAMLPVRLKNNLKIQIKKYTFYSFLLSELVPPLGNETTRRPKQALYKSMLMLISWPGSGTLVYNGTLVFFF